MLNYILLKNIYSDKSKIGIIIDKNTVELIGNDSLIHLMTKEEYSEWVKSIGNDATMDAETLTNLNEWLIANGIDTVDTTTDSLTNDEINELIYIYDSEYRYN